MPDLQAGGQHFDVVPIAVVHKAHRERLHSHVEPLGAGPEYDRPQELLRLVQPLLLRCGHLSALQGMSPSSPTRNVRRS